jgi:hypothetical protein
MSTFLSFFRSFFRVHLLLYHHRRTLQSGHCKKAKKKHIDEWFDQLVALNSSLLPTTEPAANPATGRRRRPALLPGQEFTRAKHGPAATSFLLQKGALKELGKKRKRE